MVDDESMTFFSRPGNYFRLWRNVALIFTCTLLIHGAGGLLVLLHTRGYDGAF